MNKAQKKLSRQALSEQMPGDSPVLFYPAWCKRCGNCVAFCPRKALLMDEWGYPHLPESARCTSCGLCEMLCPDFALSVGDGLAIAANASRGRGKAEPGDRPSPERLAPAPVNEESNET